MSCYVVLCFANLEFLVRFSFSLWPKVSLDCWKHEIQNVNNSAPPASNFHFRRGARRGEAGAWAWQTGAAGAWAWQTRVRQAPRPVVRGTRGSNQLVCGSAPTPFLFPPKKIDIAYRPPRFTATKYGERSLEYLQEAWTATSCCVVLWSFKLDGLLGPVKRFNG